MGEYETGSINIKEALAIWVVNWEFGNSEGWGADI